MNITFTRYEFFVNCCVYLKYRMQAEVVWWCISPVQLRAQVSLECHQHIWYELFNT